MEGVKDRLNDLSWLGITDQAWFEVDVSEPSINIKAIVDHHVAQLLEGTLSIVAPDNTSLTKAQWQAWMNYRKKLQEIPLQVGYPHEVYWPARPE